MISTPYLPAVDSLQLDSVLADAIVLNWNDLMPESKAGLIHIEYHVDCHGSVEFMKVWASTTWGYWNLICQQWMRGDPSGQSGLHFNNGYKSDGLAKALNSIMQQQEKFRLDTFPGSDRMIQVQPPTEADKAKATKITNLFRDRLAA